MKKFTLSLFALSMMAAPLAAQETPIQMAERMDACDGREVLSARMTDGNQLAVQCAQPATEQARLSTQDNGGRLGVVLPLIGLGAIGIAVGAMAGGSSSSDTQ